MEDDYVYIIIHENIVYQVPPHTQQIIDNRKDNKILSILINAVTTLIWKNLTI